MGATPHTAFGFLGGSAKEDWAALMRLFAGVTGVVNALRSSGGLRLRRAP